MKFKLDGFIIAMLLTISLAYFFPELGSKNNPFYLGIISDIGVSLIFFFYGLKLSFQKIKDGLKNWKLHVLVQLSTFLLFPILVLPFYTLATTEDTKNIWLAFLFLAALPSTVSSSVVMVGMAKGNLPSAIFNASISGLIGIVVTPIWMDLFIQNSNADFDLSAIYTKLIFQILMPVILGIFLQRYFGKYMQRYNDYLTKFDKSVILLIIFLSFCESFEENIFSSVKFNDMLLIVIGVLVLFYTVYFIIFYLTKQLKFNREDRITAQFCGTKKSLVHGAVFSKILFSTTMSSGIILLPLMLFHALQLIIISFIATNLSKDKVEI